MARTLYDKIWDEHVVHTEEDGTAILYIDRHLVHEVTSPQAFEGLRQAGRKVWRVSSIVATADHNTPTTGWERGYDGIADPISKEQVTTLDAQHRRVRRGRVLPVPVQAPGHRARDRPRAGRHAAGHDGGLRRLSHTSTHGAFGALAHGIGTSEVEHVMATQTLLAKKAKNMLVRVEGQLPRGVHRQGHRAGHHRQDRHRRRHRLHHRVRRLGHPRAEHGRPHDGVQHGHRGRRARRPGGGGRQDHRVRQGPAARAHRRRMGPGRRLLAHAALRPRREVRRRGRARRGADRARRSPGAPRPRWCWAIDGRVPDPDKEKDANKRGAIERALAYMGLEPGKPINDILIDKVFIGSCTNSRIEDMREAAAVVTQARAARWRSNVKLAHGGARLRPGEGAGRARRPARDLQGRRLRVARARLLACAWP